MNDQNRPKIGLALGSGGARGLAHIGVLKVLEENGIKPDYIAGSSIGAMIGGFYASGLSVEKIEKIALGASWRKIFSLVDPHLKCGLVAGEKIEEFIAQQLRAKEFKDCKVPFAAVATDLKTGEIVVFDSGELTNAIRASISIPLVFKPVEIAGRMLADGGLSAPVPVETVRKMGAEIAIAANLDDHSYDEQWTPKWYDIANNSLSILRHHLALANTKDAEIVIEAGLGKEYWYQFVNGKDKILAGERVMKEKLPALQGLLKVNSVAK